MELIAFEIECDKCHQKTIQWVSPIPGYNGTYLRSFYCKNIFDCGAAQVCRYRFDNDVPSFVERLEPSDVYIEPTPQIGISIKPKARTR